MLSQQQHAQSKPRAPEVTSAVRSNGRFRLANDMDRSASHDHHVTKKFYQEICHVELPVMAVLHRLNALLHIFAHTSMFLMYCWYSHYITILSQESSPSPSLFFSYRPTTPPMLPPNSPLFCPLLRPSGHEQQNRVLANLPSHNLNRLQERLTPMVPHS